MAVALVLQLLPRLLLLTGPACLAKAIPSRPTLPSTSCCSFCAGTRVPRTELTEMGPSLDLELRRSRQPPPDLEKEALRRPKLDKKKVGG